ncbi:MAG: type II secretion system protein, partial [Oscillospiraceae bacterium]|nr:type II secretion system protein [Oscillospiraceae bacterium]
MNRKRKLKGMTLIEVVISIAVYAVIGLLLTTIMSLVNSTMKATNQLNRRLSYEAKFADNMLLSDGASPFAAQNVDITLTNSTHSFNITAHGSEYTTDVDQMTRDNDPDKLIINPDTNYRFMVFTKTPEGARIPSEFFYLDLLLGSGVDSSNPITKIIVDATDAPRGDGIYAANEETGALYRTQVLTEQSKHTAPTSDGTAVNYVGLESVVSGNRLLRLAIPATQGGAALVNSTNASLGVRGSIVVKIFRTVKDKGGTGYNWYETNDVTLISKAYDKLSPAVPAEQEVRDTLDCNQVPSEARLKLDFVLSAPNPNTGEMSYYDGVEYTWNPTADPSGAGYL